MSLDQVLLYPYPKNWCCTYSWSEIMTFYIVFMPTPKLPTSTIFYQLWRAIERQQGYVALWFFLVCCLVHVALSTHKVSTKSEMPRNFHLKWIDKYSCRLAGPRRSIFWLSQKLRWIRPGSCSFSRGFQIWFQNDSITSGSKVMG